MKKELICSMTAVSLIGGLVMYHSNNVVAKEVKENNIQVLENTPYPNYEVAYTKYDETLATDIKIMLDDYEEVNSELIHELGDMITTNMMRHYYNHNNVINVSVFDEKDVVVYEYMFEEYINTIEEQREVIHEINQVHQLYFDQMKAYID